MKWQLKKHTCALVVVTWREGRGKEGASEESGIMRERREEETKQRKPNKIERKRLGDLQQVHTF
jgi:hypothetical protein